MKKYLEIVGVLWLLCVSSEAVNPNADMLDKSPDPKWLAWDQSGRSGGDRERNVHEIASRLAIVYGAPLCFEWPYVNDWRGGLEVRDVKFEIGPDQTLRSALDMFREKSDGKLLWDLVYGSICIRASDGAPDSENLLDLNISLSLDGVSTWDAMQELAHEINERATNGRQILVSPRALSTGYGPPDAFRNDIGIRLDLENVTAREALCAIIQASPLEMSYKYANHGPSQRYPNANLRGLLRITFHENGQRMRYQGQDRLTQSELNQWNIEIDATLNVDVKGALEP